MIDSWVMDLGRKGENRGSAVATNAAVPRSTKYAERTKLMRSLGRNLNAKKREKSMHEPTRGNFMASCKRKRGGGLILACLESQLGGEKDVI